MKRAILLLSVFGVHAVASMTVGASLGDIDTGKCLDNQDELKYFDMSEFIGTWFENATLNRLPYTSGKCATIQYSLNLADDTVNVKESEVVDDKDLVYNSKLYRINLIDYYRFFQIYNNMEHLPYNKKELKVLFKLLGTDYNCWAVVYHCLGDADIHKEIVTVLLRTREASCLNDTTRQTVNDLISKKLNTDFLSDFAFNNHTDCKYEELETPEEEEDDDDDEKKEEEEEDEKTTEAGNSATDEKNQNEGKKKATADVKDVGTPAPTAAPATASATAPGDGDDKGGQTKKGATKAGNSATGETEKQKEGKNEATAGVKDKKQEKTAAGGEKTQEEKTAAGGEKTQEEKTAAGGEKTQEEKTAAGGEKTQEEETATGGEKTQEEKTAAGGEKTQEEQKPEKTEETHTTPAHGRRVKKRRPAAAAQT